MFRATTTRCWNTRLRALAIWAMMPLAALDARAVCGSVCADRACNTVAGGLSCCEAVSSHLTPPPGRDAVVARTHCETYSGLQVNPMVGVETDTDGWRSMHFAVADFFAAPAVLSAVTVHRNFDSHGMYGPVADLVVELCKLII